MTKSRPLVSEEGWVMVPVIVLMAVAMAVAFALLAIVDTQTGQSREQRSKDSAQTLAEGAVSATANILADTASSAVWKITSCENVTGDMTTASGSPSTSFAAKLTKEVQDRFAGTTPDYSTTATRKTTWRVDVCPVASTDARWSDDFLTRAALPVPGGSAAGVVWVRGQAVVRSPTASTRPSNSRAVASKVSQSSKPFGPPKDYAVGTGAFSTDVGTSLNTTTSSLLGGALTKPLIADQNAKMGVRCGLLNTVHNLQTTCVTGVLAGAAGTTNALGLGVLNSALGLDRSKVLNTWSMAPKDAIDAWLAEAKASGVYSTSVAGVGNIKTKSVPAVAAGADCYSGSPTASQVIFIDQVGNGDQYCNVRANATAKMLIVRRGGVRVSAQFTGVVYALNQQECTNADGTCSAADRSGAVPREVVRIEGNSGKVTGAVWADGAGGSVGIYPSLSNLTGTNTSVNNALLNVGGAQGICGLPVVGPLLTALGTTLNGVTNLVGNVATTLLGQTQTEEQVRYPGGGSAPTGCQLLTNQLAGLGTSQLVNLFGSGASQTVVVAEHRTRTRTCRNWLVVCLQWNDYPAYPDIWTPKTTQEVSLPALLNSGTPSLIEQVAGVLSSSISNYQAILYDTSVVNNAATQINQGAGPVVGTFRNIGPAA